MPKTGKAITALRNSTASRLHFNSSKHEFSTRFDTKALVFLRGVANDPSISRSEPSKSRHTNLKQQEHYPNLSKLIKPSLHCTHYALKDELSLASNAVISPQENVSVSAYYKRQTTSNVEFKNTSNQAHRLSRNRIFI